MKDEIYKLFPNLYIHRLREDGYIGVFHPSTLNTIYIPLEAGSLLKFFHNPQILKYAKSKFFYLNDISILLDLFIREKILIPPNYNYKIEIDTIKKNIIFQRPRLRVMYIIVSEACNLRCSYCHIVKEKAHSFYLKDKNMPAEIATEAAIFFSYNAYRENKDFPPVIIFYGGEPLLNFAAIKLIAAIVRKCESKIDSQVKTKFVLITNGILFTKEIAKFLIRFNFEVGFSIDGFEDIHNKQRVKLNTESGTFKETLRGYNIFIREGGRPAISCTVGMHNVERLSEIAQYFVSKLRAAKVEFNIPYGYFNKKNLSQYMEIISINIIKAFEILRTHGVYEGRIGRHLDSTGNLKFHPYDCAAYGNQLVILPNGDLGPCHAYIPYRKYFFGNLLKSRNNIFRHKILKLWRTRTPLNMKKCIFCPAISICGGGCAFEAEMKTGSLFGKDERCCKFYNKYFLSWYVEDRYRAIIHNSKYECGSKIIPHN